MKKFYLLSVILLSTLMAGLTSCSKDEEPQVEGLNDYFIEVKCQGGGLSAADLAELQNELNAELLGVKLYKLNKDEALRIFDEFIEETKYDFIDGVSWIDGTLQLIFTIKTTKGVSVKTKTVNVTKETAWVS